MTRLQHLLTSLVLILCSTGAAADSVLVLGDSLSAAYGMNLNQGWVALTNQTLASEDNGLELIDASISGDTSAGGRARLPRLLQTYQPEWVLIELGGNDGLRGLPLNQLKANLVAIVEHTRQSGATPLLMEIHIPPNYGERYTHSFTQTFHQVAEEYGVPLMPFFVTEIALDGTLMQADGIHPTARAQPMMRDLVLDFFQHTGVVEAR